MNPDQQKLLKWARSSNYLYQPVRFEYLVERGDGTYDIIQKEPRINYLIPSFCLPIGERKVCIQSIQN